MSFLLATTIAITASIYSPDPRLEAFSAVQEAEAEAQEEEEDKPSLYWRALGWAGLIGCAAVMPTVEYRESRSSWTGTIDNPTLNFAAWTGAGQGVNVASEYVRPRDETMAWLIRAGMVVSCWTTAGVNWNRGWFHK